MPSFTKEVIITNLLSVCLLLLFVGVLEAPILIYYSCFLPIPFFSFFPIMLVGSLCPFLFPLCRFFEQTL
eukprot:m.222553 g.222553  ORF g.222553 m.222553 type:complete len:70 (-) comp16054_c0_seq1:95-304(-)